VTSCLVSGADSDIGPVRAVNQDSGYAGAHLAAVADGLGGHAAGEVASSLVVAALQRLDVDPPGTADAADQVRDRLVEAVRSAQGQLLQRVADDPDTRGMGTTLTVLVHAGDRLLLAHIGDSRAYRRSNGVLEQVTRDDTFVQQLVQEGHITADQAAVHPMRHAITASLGDAGASTSVALSEHDAVPGDRWMLCSDGVCGVLRDDVLARVLGSGLDPAACARRLVELALRAGTTDNATCVVADVVDVMGAATGSPPAAAPGTTVGAAAPGAA
jgi:protein phosphatase